MAGYGMGKRRVLYRTTFRTPRIRMGTTVLNRIYTDNTKKIYMIN